MADTCQAVKRAEKLPNDEMCLILERQIITCPWPVRPTPADSGIVALLAPISIASSKVCNHHQSNARSKTIADLLMRSVHNQALIVNTSVGGTVSFRSLGHWVAVGLLLLGGWVAASAPSAWGQNELTRKVKSKSAPTYPELARRMNITGVVKVQITVDKSGTVKNVKLVGGHPLLATAAMDAVKRYRYEPGPEETTGIVVEFRFDPSY